MAITLVFRHQQWLVNDAPFPLKSTHNCTVELFKRRHNTLQLHSLFALTKHLLITAADSNAVKHQFLFVEIG